MGWWRGGLLGKGWVEGILHTYLPDSILYQRLVVTRLDISDCLSQPERVLRVPLLRTHGVVSRRLKPSSFPFFLFPTDSATFKVSVLHGDRELSRQKPCRAARAKAGCRPTTETPRP